MTTTAIDVWISRVMTYRSELIGPPHSHASASAESRGRVLRRRRRMWVGLAASSLGLLAVILPLWVLSPLGSTPSSAGDGSVWPTPNPLPGEVVSPEFRAVEGWYYKPSVVPVGSGDVPMTWLSTVPFAEKDLASSSPGGGLVFPYQSLSALGKDDIFIVATFITPGGVVSDGDVFPPANLPLSLSNADKRPIWEGQPPSGEVPEYLLVQTVGGEFLQVRVFFGTQDPTIVTLDRAQEMLAALRPPM